MLTLAVLSSGLLAAGLLSAAGLPGPPPGKSIEFSSGNTRGTNVNQFNSRRDGLKQLEEELNKSLRPFSQGSLDGAPAPPVQPVTRVILPSKRTQELMERRKNWMLLAPNDLVAGPTAEEIFNVPTFGADGKLKDKKSPLEEFLFPQSTREKEEKEPGAKRSAGRDTDENGDPQDGANLPTSLKESQQALREKLNDKTAGLDANAGRSSLSDIFGLGSKLPAEPDPVQKARQEEWSNLWGISRPTAGGMDQLKSVFDPPRPPLATAIATPTPSVETPVVRSDFSSPAFGGVQSWQGGLPETLSKAANPQPIFDPSLALRKSEPPKLTPPVPTFTAPRRGF